MVKEKKELPPLKKGEEYSYDIDGNFIGIVKKNGTIELDSGGTLKLTKPKLTA